jgi:hypothetical protein
MKKMRSICRIFVENCQEDNPLEILGSVWNNINNLMPKIYVMDIKGLSPYPQNIYRVSITNINEFMLFMGITFVDCEDLMKHIAGHSSRAV